MSEHMQLSLALCRIGLYTVRKRTRAAFSRFENEDNVAYFVVDAFTCAGFKAARFHHGLISSSCAVRQTLTEQK